MIAPRHEESTPVSLDLHFRLPSRHKARAGRGDLLDFLRVHDAQFIYLVGDIVDGWQLKKSVVVVAGTQRRDPEAAAQAPARAQIITLYPRQSRRLRPSSMIGHALRRHRCDPPIRPCTLTADGRTLLVLHGDQFDGRGHQQRAGWPKSLGSSTPMNSPSGSTTVFNAVRTKCCGYSYWSLSAWLKHKVKNAFTYIDRLREDGGGGGRGGTRPEGVVCGHIHRASIRDLRWCRDLLQHRRLGGKLHRAG
jgi:UDP-2,3-diacylglucosamine pyrophosphatase LpxH